MDTETKRKFLNIKVGVGFFDVLMTKPSFQKNWKAVSPSFYLVQRIAELNVMKNGEPAGLFSGTIVSLFEPYTGGGYLEYLTALESLNILWNDHGNVRTDNKTGRCNKYLATDYGCHLIHSGNMEYLKKLRNDPECRRRNQKNISARKVMHKTYPDPVLDYVHDGLKNITFDLDRAERMMSKSCWSDLQKTNVSGILCSFEEKSFNIVEIKSTDGRIHHELIRLKSDARPLLQYKGLPYKAVIDIRCCHPSFLSSLLTSLSPHYLTDNQDKAPVLDQEHQKWVQLFCDPDKDPKEVIRKKCRFPDVEKAKAAINQSLNGSTKHPKFLAWMKTEFPVLYSLWQQTEVKQTGNAIARKYERQLILQKDLFDLADKLGVKIMPEHDGVGVFAKDDDEELQSKLDALANFIQSSSNRLFGVPVFVKTKRVFDWADADLMMEMEHKRDELEKQYGKWKPILTRYQRKYFSNNRDPNASRAYGEARQKDHALLLRYKDVLDYWIQREEMEAPRNRLVEKIQAAMFSEAE